MKKIILLPLMLVAFTFQLALAADVKIGFVDVRKAVESTKAGKKIKSELESDFKKREKSLKKQAEDIEKMKEDFEKKFAVLSDKAKAKKQQEIQEEMIKHNQDIAKNTQDIRKKELDLMKPVFEKMQKVINEIAKKDKYTIILQSRDNNIVYAQDEIDITTQVVKAFEKK